MKTVAQSGKFVVMFVFCLLALVMPGSQGFGDEVRKVKKVAKAQKPKNGSLILFMNYPYEIAGDGVTKIHVTLLTPDFRPAAGAKVTVNGKAMATADRNGTAIFDYKPGNKERHKLVARYTDKTGRYGASRSFTCNARTESFRSDQLFVYTDRGVYNPGDAIQVRLLAWELLGDYKAIPSAKISLLLQTPGGRILGGQALTTNSFGVASGKFLLPQNMPQGDYELVVLYNQARESARLRVERFVPPLMDIKHSLGRFMTPAFQTLPVQVTLSWFSGGIPLGAKMDLTVLSPSQAQLFTKPLEEKAPGKFEATLTAADLDTIRPGLALDQPFKIRLEAKDVFGRVSRVDRDMIYTQRPYQTVLELDKDSYPAHEQVKLNVRVVDFDGRPAAGIDVKVSVPEFKVEQDGKTDATGVAILSFPMGAVTATATVTSPVVVLPLGEIAVPFTAVKPMTSKVDQPPTRQGLQTQIRATFDRNYVPVEKVVHVDLTDISGALVASTTIPIVQESDGLYVAQGMITAPTWGTMLANLYVAVTTKENSGKPLTVANVGFVTEGQHVAIYPDAQAKIVIEGLKPKAAPGERQEVRIRVTTPSGSEAALGASLVDAAVLSLLDPLEKSPTEHFYNSQRKVISTGGAGVLTWPVVDRNWGEPWRDIAYSNWGFKEPGAMVDRQQLSEELSGDGLGGGGGGGGGGGFGSSGTAYGTISGIGDAPSKEVVVIEAKIEEAKTKIKTEKKGTKYQFSEMLIEGEMAKPDPTGMPAGPEDKRRDNKREAPHIVIRTQFPDTALWEPLLVTRDHEVVVAVHFPDSITTQRLTLVASDKSGNVGTFQQDVQVVQELFVQADVPASMTLGDDLQVGAGVRNLSGSDQEASVEFTSKEMAVSGANPQRILVKAGEIGYATWTVRPLKAGPATYTVSATTPQFRDEEVKQATILPAGEAVTQQVEGDLEAGKPFTSRFELDPKATARTVFLNVSFPNVIPALQAWDALQALPICFVGVQGIASRAILDAALFDWAGHSEKQVQLQDTLRTRLVQAGMELAAVQLPNGAFGWFYRADASHDRDGFYTSVYLTAYALRALLEIRRCDLAVDDQALSQAAHFLLVSRNTEGLWSSHGAYFWQADDAGTDWALSAELFDLLVRTHMALNQPANPEMTELKVKLETKLASSPQEPAVVAHIMAGMLHWGTWNKDSGARKQAAKQIPYLLSLKRTAHWEPHWYHAYGGMVELNALILELLSELDPKGNDGIVREIVQWLLSTRTAWGAWHNESGTAAAVRALLRAGAGATKEVPSQVTVTVNGSLAAKVDIDPADPLLSAANLRQLELTNLVQNGSNQIEVTYNGKLTAPVTLEVSQWGVPTTPSSPTSLPDAPRLRLERTAPPLCRPRRTRQSGNQTPGQPPNGIGSSRGRNSIQCISRPRFT